MIVADIIEEVKEVTGNSDLTFNFRALTRGIEILANEGLFDPLLGYLDFYVSGGFTIALPREVKIPIRINLNSNPAFPRSRMFEFTMNTNGSVDGEEVGWNWSDRGDVCLQDETVLPSKLAYRVSNAVDSGKTLIIEGIDSDGRVHKETLIGDVAGGPQSQTIFVAVRRVYREPTESEAYLDSDTNPAARYYPDETSPSYRAIKLSKTDAAVRIQYRRKTFAITSLQDEIPLHSPMAVIQIVKAVRLMQEENWTLAAAAQAKAVEFIQKEQATLDAPNTTSDDIDVQTATDTNINTRDAIIVADIYDDAADIFQGVGRQKLFDRISDAIEVLSQRGNWTSTLGVVDVWKSDTSEEATVQGGSRGHGYFVLPSDVESVLALNYSGIPSMPRNQWYEFSQNGNGERTTSSINYWDDCGETPIINALPIDADTKRVIPTKVIAIPYDSQDADTVIRIYGYEMDENNQEVEVARNGEFGWLCPCPASGLNPGTDAPRFTRIERITKARSRGFIRLVSLTESAGPVFAENKLLGYWHPEDTAPLYRLIKVQSPKEARIRIRYRRRVRKITSLHDYIPLRSRLAVVAMLRALSLQGSDMEAAAGQEAIAIQRLRDEQSANSRPAPGGLQFNTTIHPAHTRNIQ